MAYEKQSNSGRIPEPEETTGLIVTTIGRIETLGFNLTRLIGFTRYRVQNVMKRNKHNLSHYKLATMDMGPLYPVGIMEVLPGDTFQHRTSALIRLAPRPFVARGAQW